MATLPRPSPPDRNEPRAGGGTSYTRPVRLSTAILLLSFGCHGAPEPDSGSPPDPTVLFHADRLGEASTSQVLILPANASLWEDPDATVGAGTTDEAFSVPAGDWTAEVGEVYDADGFFDGQAFHVEEDGTYWIAPPETFHATPGSAIEHTFVLNFLATGWWECCAEFPSGARVCGMNDVDYHDGRLAVLPGLGVMEVAGMSFAGTLEDGSTAVGAFDDAVSASAVVTDNDAVARPVECCKGTCDG
jgi:hypothetical protein